MFTGLNQLLRKVQQTLSFFGLIVVNRISSRFIDLNQCLTKSHYWQQGKHLLAIKLGMII